MTTFKHEFPNGIPEDFNIYCKKCGDGLCNNSKPHKSKSGNAVLLIEPCEKCSSAQFKAIRVGVAHYSNPGDFRDQMKILLMSDKDTAEELARKITDYLNSINFNDCIFKPMEEA